MSTLVLGIGNTLLTDEGIGVYAIQYLSQMHGDFPDTEFLDGGTLSFTLAAPIEDADNLIVIDATNFNDVPGTVRSYVGDDMDKFLYGQSKRSVHEVGLMDLMTIVRLADRLPKNRALIGIQPKTVDWGEQPTKEVETAFPTVQKIFLNLINEWHEQRGIRYGTAS